MRFTSSLRPSALVLAALLSSTHAFAQCPLDDSFEENDNCASASIAPLGLTSGLVLKGAANVGGLDEDYWLIQGVPAGQIVTVDLLFSDATGDIDLRIFSDPGTCATQIGYSGSVSDNEQVSAANGSAGPVDYAIRVQAFGSSFDCNGYDLQVSVAPDPCAVAIDDSFEENDDCASSVALAAGAHLGLFASETDADFYTVAVPAGDVLTVDVTYASGVNGDVDLFLYDDAACLSQVDVNYSFGGAGQVSWSNVSGAAVNVRLKAEVAVGAGCNNYDLNVATAPDPCLNPLADDVLEDNDDCTNAVPMFDGLTTNLFVSKADEDFYEVTVADLDALTVNMYSPVVPGDIDIYLYDTLASCGDLTSYLVRGYTSTDDESISWTNTTGSSQTYYIQVVVWANSAGDCNNYDLEIIGSGGAFATSMCFGDGSGTACPCANESVLGAGEGCKSSLGVGAILTAAGSASVAADDLSFTVTQARANQPSMLVQGATLIGTPFKDGVLCMGNPTERVEVVFLDPTGSGTTVSSIVTNGNVAPGDTRYYQQWFRDPGGVSPCGNGSNFSNGLQILWN